MRHLVGLKSPLLIFRESAGALPGSTAPNWLAAYFFSMDLTVFVMGLVFAFGELLNSNNRAVIGTYALSTMAIFMIGWICGALVFTRLNQNVHRCHFSTLSIFLYALFTGLCAFAQCGVELTSYRFIVGFAIGMEVGVAGISFYLSRLRGINLLQASAPVLIVLALGYLVSFGLKETFSLDVWRVLFLVGALPALPLLYSRVSKS
jgi:MFS family permease